MLDETGGNVLYGHLISSEKYPFYAINVVSLSPNVHWEGQEQKRTNIVQQDVEATQREQWSLLYTQQILDVPREIQAAVPIRDDVQQRLKSWFLVH